MYHSGRQEITFGRDISIGFEVPSLDGMIELLKEKGVDIKAGPMQPNPFTKFLFVEDPNGVRVQFVEHKK
jgi:lactoylglutathione lyase